MRQGIKTSFLILLAGAGIPRLVLGQPDSRPTTDWYGFERYDYLMDTQTLSLSRVRRPEADGAGVSRQFEGQLRCVLVQPRQAAAGQPWSWRGRYFNHEPQVEKELLRRGYHIAYVQSDELKHWDRWYRFLIEKHDLSAKPAFVGMSGGGRNAYSWATAFPDRVSCIYADNPLITREGLMRLDRLAQRDIPLLHICGSLDPLSVNHTLPIEGFYRQLGGRITVMVKDGTGHHPHSLRNPKRIADFISQSRHRKTERPPFVTEEAARTAVYSSRESYLRFETEDMFVTCRGHLFAPAFYRYRFKPTGSTGEVSVIAPTEEASGRPWVLRPDPLSPDSEVDLSLLAAGYHIVAAPRPRDPGVTLMEEWNQIYRFLTANGFASKPAIEATGGAAAEAYEWAIQNPTRIRCIYGANPILRHYSSPSQPLDNLQPLADAGVPIMHICGSRDPWLKSQSQVLKSRYEALGGSVRIIILQGVGHDISDHLDIEQAQAFIMSKGSLPNHTESPAEN